MLGVSFVIAKSVSVFDSDVLSLNVAEAAQSLTESCEVGLRGGRGFHRDENPDPRDVPRLLMSRSGERRNHEAGSENDREPDPPHRHLV